MLCLVEVCYEVCWLIGWFDDKFYYEVIVKLLGECVFCKVMGIGYFDSLNVKVGVKVIKYYFDYMVWLLEKWCWLVGNDLILVDFVVVVQLLCLDYILDVDWNCVESVKDWYVKIKLCLVFWLIFVDQVLGFLLLF